ncbi:MAG: TlpA disulfide reductase family protein [Acidobacteriota bacterium]
MRGVTSRVGRAAAVVMVSLTLGGLLGCGEISMGGVSVGEPMPAFDLPLLDGGSLASDDLAGDGPVVVNFWATWCGPCVREIPTLNALHRDGGARVVAISLDDASADVVRAFVEDEGIDYPVLLGDMETFQRFGGAAIPYTVVADAGLVVRDAHRGLVSRTTLDRSLAKATDS